MIRYLQLASLLNIALHTAPHTFGAFSCRRFCRRSKEKQITGGKSFIFCCFLTTKRSVLRSPSSGDEAYHADLRKISPPLPTGAKALKLQLFQHVAGQSTAAKWVHRRRRTEHVLTFPFSNRHTFFYLLKPWKIYYPSFGRRRRRWPESAAIAIISLPALIRIKKEKKWN